MQDRLNLQHPLQARRWLQLLVEDPRCGFRLRPGLDLPRGRLGFSVRSNQLGLRGPADGQAGRVVLGTSFAMGIAVDNGENWYDRCLPDKGWLNLGLPVGINEWAELMAQHHHGPKDLALLVYHPNIWMHCLMYERWRNSGAGVFTALRWKTGWAACAWLAIKRACRQPLARARGLRISIPHHGQRHEVDTWYSRIDIGRFGELIERNLGRLADLLAPFQRIVVVRVPIKQELIPHGEKFPQIVAARQNFDELWDRTQERLIRRGGADFRQLGIFQLDHFHPRDSHWNAEGNRLFAASVTDILGEMDR